MILSFNKTLVLSFRICGKSFKVCERHWEFEGNTYDGFYWKNMHFWGLLSKVWGIFLICENVLINIYRIGRHYSILDWSVIGQHRLSSLLTRPTTWHDIYKLRWSGAVTLFADKLKISLAPHFSVGALIGWIRIVWRILTNEIDYGGVSNLQLQHRLKRRQKLKKSLPCVEQNLYRHLFKM